MNKPDIRRLAVAAHYVIARTEPSKLGMVKLNKVLWYADLECYRRSGETVTGLQNYVRQPLGPVPYGVEAAIRLLKDEGKVLARRSRVIDHERREFVTLKEPDISIFSPEQIDILNVYMDIIKEHNAQVVSDVSHDALWGELSDGDLMSVSAGSVIARRPNSRELAWANSLS